MSAATPPPNRADSAPSQRPKRSRARAKSGAESARVHLVGVRLNDSMQRALDAYAGAHGITRSRAASEFLDIAREALRTPESVSNERTSELIEMLEGVRTLLHLIGPPVIATLRLLAHWSSQSGLRVGEDDLLAELRFVAAEEWEQVTTEAERELHARALATEQGS